MTLDRAARLPSKENAAKALKVFSHRAGGAAVKTKTETSLWRSGILTSRDSALRNVKRTYRVTAFDIGPRSSPPFKGECSKSPQGFLASRRGRSIKTKTETSLWRSGILTSRGSALRNVKRTYRVTAFDIGPRSLSPFKGECSKSPQGFLASRRGRSSKNKNGKNRTAGQKEEKILKSRRKEESPHESRCFSRRDRLDNNTGQCF